MDISRVICLAVFAGEIMLKSGAETYRVEETIIRMCNSYNIKNCDSFVTPTGIITSALNEYGESISIVRRIKCRTVDLQKVSDVNNLSRRVCTEDLDLDYIEEELKKINESKMYSNKILLLGSCIGAGFFTLVFGGTIHDFFVSLFIGAAIQITSRILNKIDTNLFLVNASGGAIASLLALISTSLGLGDNTDKIVIGSLMLLVPGLAITNAIRDTLAGDLVAGTSRSAEAFFTAIAIAVGSGIVFSLWIKYLGGVFT